MAEQNRPRQGGSYLKDPKTGKVTLQHRTQPRPSVAEKQKEADKQAEKKGE